MFKWLLQKVLGFNKQVSDKKGLIKTEERQPLVTNLETNLQALRQVFDLCSDIVFQEFKINADNTLNAALVYTDGLTDLNSIREHLMSAVMIETSNLPTSVHFGVESFVQLILNRLSSLTNVQTINDMKELIDAIAGSSVTLLVNGSPTAIIINAPGGEGRSIKEPETEPVVFGPKDGFVENVSTNISLLRRRIKSSRFKSEVYKVGIITKTQVVICYIKGIANDKVVEEVKTRIKRIKIDGILDSNYLVEFISDERFSLFPLIQTTERPDKAAASLLEGKIAIIVDNTPMTLIVPCTFISLMQSSEDYYILAPFATLIRLLRFIALNIALLLPAITVAAFSFNQELIPTALLNTVAGARQELPLPIFLEVLFMEFTFELLREAGVRLPKTIGQAISTVGGLVIGQALVNAGFISLTTVIVVSLTAIASFTNPNYMAGTSLRVLRFFLLILSAILGGVGIMLGLMVILVHLCSLRSFGIPYLSPIAPLSPRDLKDTIVRSPWWAMLNRPHLLGNQKSVRQDTNQAPYKPDEGGEQK